MPDTTAPTRPHYNAARLRSHTWDQLKLAASSLDEEEMPLKWKPC
mgnify:CR=1 FL=1